MPNYSKLAKGLTSLVKGTQEVLPAAEREANLAKMLSNSAEKRKMYHGSKEPNIKEFKTRKDLTDESMRTGHYADERDAVFLSPEPDFTKNFSQMGYTDTNQAPTTYPVYVQVKNPFDFDNPEHLKQVKETYKDMFLNPESEFYEHHILPSERSMAMHTFNKRVDSLPSDENNWARIESQDFQDVLKDLGFDSFYTRERGTKNLGVYDPTQIKSAIGNKGKYDLTNPDINEAKGGSIQGGLSRFADGGAAFGVMPQMKPRRAHQDREASKNVPVDAARGFVAGALGAPGDLESLIRMLPYLDEKTILPTSEEIEKRLPFKSDTPVSRAATGLGQLGGSFYTGPGSGFHALGSAYKGAKTLGKELAETAGHRIATGQSLIPGVPTSLANPPVMHIVKPTGGNWLPSTDRIVYRTQLDRELEKLQKGKHNPNSQYIKEMLEDAVARGDAPQVAGFTRDLQNAIGNEATNKWVKSNLSNYITKQMGTEADPVRKLAEEGITAFPKNVDEFGDLELHTLPNYDVKGRREAFGSPVKGVAQNPLAKHYEFLADQAILPTQAKHYQRVQALPDMQRPRGFADMPWINKIDPETNIYSLSGDAEFGKMGFDHIMDVLREDVAAGRIRPEQLNKVSMEDAVRRTHQYDEELKAKMLNARVAEQTSAKVHKEYPEGYKWVQLDQPGQFALESDIMGHSVRGYEPPQGHPDWTDISGNSGYNDYGHGGYEAIKSGAAKIYSLRDPKGMSHATVEVGPSIRGIKERTDWFAKQPEEIQEKITQEALELEKTYGGARQDWQKAYSTVLDKYMGKQAPRISQIKGKQNAAPNEEYLPYVQDFVRSGQYSDVGDIANTGLKPLTHINEDTINKIGLKIPKYVTEQELKDLNDFIYNYKPEHGLPHEVALPESIQKFRVEKTPPEGMAQGGAIHMQVGGLSALAKLGKAGTKLSKAEEAAVRAGKGVNYADPLLPPDMRMSEALGIAGAEGKYLNFTEADRSRVFGPNRGGVGFSALQHYSVPHKKANTVWGFGNQSTAEKKIAQNDPDNTIWTTYAGSPEQHKSNTVVVKDAIQTLQNANKAGAVNPEQIRLINERIRQAVSEKGKPLFPEGFDITDPQALSLATTFDRRTAISDALLGTGVKKPMISREFKEANPGVKWSDASNISGILTRETDPVLMGANTFDVGPHLFTMDNKIINRPDLNEAFPIQVTGTDLGLRYKPTPIKNAAPEFIAKKGYGENDPVNAWAMSRGAPRQFVSEDYLTNLQKEGHKDGGSVEQMSWLDALNNHHRKMAGGGVVNMSDTMPDVTDGENIIPHSFYAKGGQVLSYEDSNNFLRNMYGN